MVGQSSNNNGIAATMEQPHEPLPETMACAATNVLLKAQITEAGAECANGHVRFAETEVEPATVPAAAAVAEPHPAPENPQNEKVDDMAAFCSPKISRAGSLGLFPVILDDDFTSTLNLPESVQMYSVAGAKGKYLAAISALLRHTPDVAERCFQRVFVEDLCRDAIAVLREEAAMKRLSVDAGETLIVVGDIHGQFHDLIAHVLRYQLEKAATAVDYRFLFLGDYVDRGPQGVEVLMLLLALKIEYPHLIHLLRGNHEEGHTSRIYGFYNEVRSKFQSDAVVWALFNEVFCYLPLAALVQCGDRKFAAVHGGLSPSWQELTLLDSIERSDYGGMLDNTSSEVIDGILWSDPTDTIPRFITNERGCGFAFGPVASSEFCQGNDLAFLCRAHQVAMEGFAWTHEHRCLTVFSAPNYCGLNNRGAILLINEHMDIRVVQYQPAFVDDMEDDVPQEPSTEAIPSYFTQNPAIDDDDDGTQGYC